MTRGFFVEEDKGVVVKAVGLCSDAYLDGGYGEEILEAFANGTEQVLLDSMIKGMTLLQQEDIASIHPGWYRKKGKVPAGASYAEYGYALNGGVLFIYYYGNLLFSATRETADKWLFVVRNLRRCYNTYLYSQSMLEIDYGQKRKMFSGLKSRIEDGLLPEELDMELRPPEYVPVILDDVHLVDVWHREDKPAYIKRLHINGRIINFIAAKHFSKWQISMQLPFIRSPILSEHNSEKGAMTELRDFVRSHLDELDRFAEVYDYVEQMLKAAQTDTAFDVAGLVDSLKKMYAERKWFTTDSFTISAISGEAYNALRRAAEKAMDKALEN